MNSEETKLREDLKVHSKKFCFLLSPVVAAANLDLLLHLE